MNKHEEIIAKSEKNGSITLYDHLFQVGLIAEKYAAHLGFDSDLVRTGAFFHDIGKASPILFITTINTNNSVCGRGFPF
jgi:HD superfamily phosphodiesterase